jgi:hypothetical protein
MGQAQDQIMLAAQLCRSPFTVAELEQAMADTWSASTLDRALAQLVEAGELSQVRQYPRRQYVVGQPQASTLADPAPDWGRCYPSGGAQIGPTWQAVWERMYGGQWCDVRELLAVGEAVCGCAESTVRNMLFAAAKAGHIEPEARQDPETNRWRIWYRRPAVAS